MYTKPTLIAEATLLNSRPSSVNNTPSKLLDTFNKSLCPKIR
jgi:hypothetical protein